MTDTEQKQVKMHQDFFGRCRTALDNGFYLEALLMEYAAIESRLEAVCGMLGLNCGKDCSFRKDVKISPRIECLKAYRNQNPVVFSKTKLPKHFFTEKGELKKWICSRNKIVHGLYKSEIEYTGRIRNSKELAEKGLEYARMLYNEAKRIHRLTKNHSELIQNGTFICKEKCRPYNQRGEE